MYNINRKFKIALFLIVSALIGVYGCQKKPEISIKPSPKQKTYAERLSEVETLYNEGKVKSAAALSQELINQEPCRPGAYLHLADISLKKPSPDWERIAEFVEKSLDKIKPDGDEERKQFLQLKAVLVIACINTNRFDRAKEMIRKEIEIDQYLPYGSSCIAFTLMDYISMESEDDDPEAGKKARQKLIESLSEGQRKAKSNFSRLILQSWEGLMLDKPDQTYSSLKNALENPESGKYIVARDRAFLRYCMGIIALKSGRKEDAVEQFKQVGDIFKNTPDLTKDWGFLVYMNLTERLFMPEQKNNELAYEYIRNRFVDHIKKFDDAESMKWVELWDDYFKYSHNKKYELALEALKKIIKIESQWEPCQYGDEDEQGKTGPDEDRREDSELEGDPFVDMLTLPHKKYIRCLMLGNLYEKTGKKDIAEKFFRDAKKIYDGSGK
ncbi:MAG: hypothetical protein K8T10_11090 [Candidatus Eremiobacteraeota bacterium]|nr:hypothetical protein [Candidatus Eremiobacteraeota bacterium]